MAALLRVAGRDPARAVAADLGFAAGPRLNAAGRLDDMSLGIECLLCADPARALEMAASLDELNRSRREIEAGMHAEALRCLERLASTQESALPWGLCLYDRSWHQGVSGILASRMRERLHRPVIAFAPAGDGQIKGSARSITGLHVRDVLDAVATRNPGLIRRFGGHAMAAGLSLDELDFDAFAGAFDAEVRRLLSAGDLEAVLLTDGELSPADMHLDLAETLRSAAPWGQGFPEPLFEGEFAVRAARVVGERHLKLKLQTDDVPGVFDAIAFNVAGPQVAPVGGRVRAAYRLDVNEYRGARALQLRVEYVEPLVQE